MVSNNAKYFVGAIIRKTSQFAIDERVAQDVVEGYDTEEALLELLSETHQLAKAAERRMKKEADGGE